MADHKDAAIAEGLRQRKEEALEALQARYGRYLYKIAFGMLGVAEDAEECLSDSLQRLWEQPPPENVMDLQHYAAKITRNIALHRLRDARRQKRGGGNETLPLTELEEMLPDRETPEELLDRKELTAALNRFLSRQTEMERSIFLRRYWYRESVVALARDYSMKESSLRSILSRMREKLRLELEQQGFGVKSTAPCKKGE